VVNHDNINVVHRYFFVKNIRATNSGVLVESDSLAYMSSLEDVTLIVNSFHILQ